MQGKRYITTTILLTVLLLAVMPFRATTDSIRKADKSVVRLRPGVEDLGQPVPGATDLWDLDAYRSGSKYRIYGVTGSVVRLFFYEPDTGQFTLMKDYPGRPWYSLESIEVDNPTGAQRKRLIFAGTAGSPCLSVYDPDEPWKPHSNPVHLGSPIPVCPYYGVIFDLTKTIDGRLLSGCTGYDACFNWTDCAYVFVYDPNGEWNPGEEQGNNPRFRKFPGQVAVTRLTPGHDPNIMYGLARSAKPAVRFYLFKYILEKNAIRTIMELPAPTDIGHGALTTGLDGRIYIGLGQDMYVYHPSHPRMGVRKANGQVPAKGIFWRMVTGLDGAIYGGTDKGELIRYCPWKPWSPNNPCNIGQAIQGETRVRSLAAGDHYIYLGTAFHAHFGGYTPFPVTPAMDVGAKSSKWRTDDEILAVKQSCFATQPAVEVYPAYPDPCNPDVWIPYKITREVGNVAVCIYNVSGQLVRTLDLGSKKSGSYMMKDSAAYWDGKDASGEPVCSGIYFYQIRAGDSTVTRKMVVVK